MNRWYAGGVVVLALFAPLATAKGCGGPARPEPSVVASARTASQSFRGELTPDRPTVEFTLAPGTRATTVRIRITEITNRSRQELALTVAVASRSGTPPQRAAVGVASPNPPDKPASFVFGLPPAARAIAELLVVGVTGVPADAPLSPDVRLVVEAVLAG